MLGFDWSIRYGDQPEWYTATERPRGWDTLNVGLSWESQGFRNHDVACLRNEVVVPTGYRNAGVRLELRQHAEAVDVFVNGRQLVSALAKDKAESVTLPPDLVRWGKPNQIALRVRQHAWTGGDVPDWIRLVPASGNAPGVRLEATFPSPDHEFSQGGIVTLPLRLVAEGAERIEGKLSLKLESDFHETLLAREDSLTALGSGVDKTLALGQLPPGFYRLILRFSAPGLELQRIHMLAVAPARILSAPDPVPDLDAFWARTLRELAAIPPKFQMVRDEARSTARHAVHSVEMTSLGGIVVRAWYVVPTKPGRYPAVLHVPGYSVAMQPEAFMQDDDVAHLALDVRGHGRSADVVNPGFGMPGYVGFEVGDAERYVYRGAYMDCGRALEFLASREEVDRTRIAVEGMSQGGGLAFATAALFPEHVRACAAGVPFLGAFGDHIRLRSIYGDEMRTHLKLAGKGTWTDTLRSMNLIDTRNLAARIRAPVFMAVALFDDDCPPRIGFAVYNNIKAPREYRVLPEDSHLMGGKWPALAREYIRRQLGLR
jgi:cephalosporin-C deacetylase